MPLARQAIAKLELANVHTQPVTACAFSPDGRWVLSASSDNTLRPWDATTGPLLRKHLHAPGASAAWTADGSDLLHASGAAWRHLRWWATTPEHPMGGSWPLECPPEGKTVVVEPWGRALLQTVTCSAHAGLHAGVA